MLLYYITDRKQFPGGEAEQRRRLLEKIAEAAKENVDYIQLREKDLPARAIEELAREAMRAVRERSSVTRLLINSRTDLALACGADGVHLTTTDIAPGDARAIAASSHLQGTLPANAKPAVPRPFLIAASTHSVAEVEFAYGQGADFVVFGPVFEKIALSQRAGVGPDQLRRACAALNQSAGSFPILALGGVTLENTAECIHAGATGIAAIRLFQENDVSTVVSSLRGIGAQADNP